MDQNLNGGGATASLFFLGLPRKSPISGERQKARNF